MRDFHGVILMGSTSGFASPVLDSSDHDAGACAPVGRTPTPFLPSKPPAKAKWVWVDYIVRRWLCPKPNIVERASVNAHGT